MFDFLLYVIFFQEFWKENIHWAWPVIQKTSLYLYTYTFNLKGKDPAIFLQLKLHRSFVKDSSYFIYI